MLLLVDNYDSFTYNLKDYFLRCNAEVDVIRNDQIDLDKIGHKYKGIILSPGPGTPENTINLLSIIKRYHTRLPLFGVCLGMQAIGQYFGATLQRATTPVHGKTSMIKYNAQHALFQNITPPLEVCRYHSLVLTDLNKTDLQILATSNENEIMAIAHSCLPIWGVQFHPEAILTSQGQDIINNWLTCFSLHSI